MNQNNNTKNHSKVLIIDDYEMTCVAVAMFFDELGFGYDIAHTAKHGLEIARKNLDYDIILIDLNLPDDNGINLVKTLRSDESFSKSKIVIFTGNNNNTLSYYHQNGVDGLLIKPCNREKIIQIIDMPSNRYTYFNTVNTIHKHNN